MKKMNFNEPLSNNEIINNIANPISYMYIDKYPHKQNFVQQDFNNLIMNVNDKPLVNTPSRNYSLQVANFAAFNHNKQLEYNKQNRKLFGRRIADIIK